MKRTLKPIVPVVLVVGALLVVATVAPADPPTGQTVSPPLVGALKPVDRISADGVRFRTRRPMEVATFTVTLAPGGDTGWHRHPGLLFVTVQAGTVIRDVGCRSRTYGAGRSFVEHGDEPTGQVRNASRSEAAVFSVTHIAPPELPKRIEDVAPDC